MRAIIPNHSANPFLYLKKCSLDAMRIMLMLGLPLLLVLSCGTDQAIEAHHISGEIDSIPKDGGMVILQRFNPITQERIPIDTAVVDAEGTYDLAYELSKPDLMQIHFPGRQSVTIVVDVGQRNIILNVEGKRNGYVKLAGSTDAQLLLDYDHFRQQSYNRLVRPPYIAMTQASKANDQAAEIAAVEEYVQNSKIHRQELLDHTQDHIGTSIALYGTVLRWTGDEDIATLEKLVTEFKTVHPDLDMSAIMSDKVARYKRVAVGSVIPELIEKSNNGEMVDIKDVMGKYTLIDFWASWCRPCILQIPDLKECHDAFSAAGFQIFGVSLDYEAEKWKNAIEEYALNWPHVSDVQGWQSKHSTTFNVTFVPFNLLIDDQGRIVAKNLHSKALFKKLASLLEAT